MILRQKCRRIIAQLELARRPELLHQRPHLIAVETRERRTEERQPRLVNPAGIAQRPHRLVAQQLAHKLILLRSGPVESHGDLPWRTVVPRDHPRIERRTIAAQSRTAGVADHAQGGTIRPRTHDESAGGHRGDALRIRAPQQHLGDLTIDRFGGVAPRIDRVLKVLRLFPDAVAIAALRRDLHPHAAVLRALGEMHEIHDPTIGRERSGAIGHPRIGEHRALPTTRVAQGGLPFGRGPIRLHGTRLRLHHRQRLTLESDLGFRGGRGRGLEQRLQGSLRVQHA